MHHNFSCETLDLHSCDYNHSANLSAYTRHSSLSDEGSTCGIILSDLVVGCTSSSVQEVSSSAVLTAFRWRASFRASCCKLLQCQTFILASLWLLRALLLQIAEELGFHNCNQSHSVTLHDISLPGIFVFQCRRCGRRRVRLARSLCRHWRQKPSWLCFSLFHCWSVTPCRSQSPCVLMRLAPPCRFVAFAFHVASP